MKKETMVKVVAIFIVGMFIGTAFAVAVMAMVS